MKTEVKIQIAKLLSGAVRVSRKLTGKSEQEGTFKRGNIDWHLDLTEGIDLQIYLFGRFEPATARKLEEMSANAKTILDIGANIGSHTLPMAAASSPESLIYAFEPTDWAVSRLNRNLELNPTLKKKVKVCQIALGDEDKSSIAGFYSSWSLTSKEGQQHPVHKGFFQASTQAKQMTLDHFCRDHQISKVDLIKMDVDGFEVKVLKGAKDVLSKHRPILIFELSPYVLEENGDRIEDLFEILKECRYQIRSLSGRELELDGARLRKDLAGGGMNVMAVPLSSANHLQIP